MNNFSIKIGDIFNTYDDIFEIHKRLDILYKEYKEYLNNEETELIYKYFAMALDETLYYINDYIEFLIN